MVELERLLEKRRKSLNAQIFENEASSPPPTSREVSTAPVTAYRSDWTVFPKLHSWGVVTSTFQMPSPSPSPGWQTNKVRAKVGAPRRISDCEPSPRCSEFSDFSGASPRLSEFEPSPGSECEMPQAVKSSEDTLSESGLRKLRRRLDSDFGRSVSKAQFEAAVAAAGATGSHAGSGTGRVSTGRVSAMVNDLETSKGKGSLTWSEEVDSLEDEEGVSGCPVRSSLSNRLRNLPTPGRLTSRTPRQKTRDEPSCGMQFAQLACMSREKEPMASSRQSTARDIPTSSRPSTAREAEASGSFGSTFHELFLQTRAYFDAALDADLNLRPSRKKAQSLRSKVRFE